MNQLLLTIIVCGAGAIQLGSPAPAASSSNYGIDPEVAYGIDPTRPDSPGRDVPQNSTEYAIGSLLRTEGTHAGASSDSKDMKSLVSPSIGNPTDEGFDSPDAYAEYKFAKIQDKRGNGLGLDGPQHNGTVGFDFVSYWNTIVGFNFTYTNTALKDNGSAGFTQLENSSEAYFFSPYVAKNFLDWINVGAAFTYGRTDTSFRSVSAGFNQDTTQDTYAYSPFVGIAHTWGAFSFSSTPTYIYGYDHFSFAPTTTGFGTGPAPGDAKTLNQSFLWLNNFQYAIDDKWSVSIQANWTRLLTTQAVPVASVPGVTPLTFAHQWMSFGVRTDYNFNKNGSVFVGYEHDAFNVHFDDYRIRTGISYNF